MRAPIGLGEAVETTSRATCRARWYPRGHDGAGWADLRRRDPPGPRRAFLRRADELGARSLALVAFGTGVGGFPLEEAARIEVEEVHRAASMRGGGLDRVVVRRPRGRRRDAAFEHALA